MIILQTMPISSPFEIAAVVVFGLALGAWMSLFLSEVESRTPRGRMLARLNAWALREERGVRPNPFPDTRL